MSVYLAYRQRFFVNDSGRVHLGLTKWRLDYLRKMGHHSGEGKLWTVLEGKFNRQKRFNITICVNQNLTDELLIHLRGPILSSLKANFPTQRLMLKLQVERLKKTWNFDCVIDENGSTTYQKPMSQTDLDDFRQAFKSDDMKMSVELVPPPPTFKNPTEALGKKVLEEQIQCDFELIAENGIRISCHKVFLAGHSEVFNRMFQTNCRESIENACEWKLPEERVRTFLKYVYYGDIEDARANQRAAFDLMEIGHKYDIASLESTMKSILLGLPTASADVNVALLLFSFGLKVDGYEDLKKKAVLVIKSKPKEVLECNVLDTILKYDEQTAKELLAIGLHK